MLLYTPVTTSTSVWAGSLYCDCALRVGGFTGEGVQGPSVLAMKTHNLKVQFVGGHVFSNTRVPYGAAVLLVRDPRRALVAEWNRERSKRMTSPNVSNHFTYVGEEYFGELERNNYFGERCRTTVTHVSVPTEKPLNSGQLFSKRLSSIWRFKFTGIIGKGPQCVLYMEVFWYRILHLECS